MIITQTPLRISLLGGGTDFPDFYATEPGAVLSATIDKYVYVVLKPRFDERIRVGYTRTELVQDVSALEHDLVREALRLTGIRQGVEVSTMADIPTRGSGLGSSSTVSVGLLHAMWTYLGDLPSHERLAEGACCIELERLGRPGGKQDQYAAAFGGLRFITFKGERVEVAPAGSGPGLARRLGERLLLFYTGLTRRSADVLHEQRHNIEASRPALRRLRQLAEQGREALCAGQLDELGALLHDSWQLKRGLASRVTSGAIDDLYETARRAGALGGKISGAGGGGFLLLYCQPERQATLRAALDGYQELEFSLEDGGSLVLLNDRRR
jgi:D-glycero-alpha-D-manno-heptose-7-phosphate kinase